MTPYKDPEQRRTCWRESQRKHRRLLAEKKQEQSSNSGKQTEE